MVGRYVVGLHEVDERCVALVGGKAAYLGVLSRIDGVRVPDGFVVTTYAFRRIKAGATSLDEQLERLSLLDPYDSTSVRDVSADIRRTIEGTAVPGDIERAVTRALARLGEHGAYAVRSSATAEDLPTASSAGQHDSYVDVVGPDAVLEHIRLCWASLFTERAVTYRRMKGIDDRTVDMAVVVQRMVVPQAAGVMFTADPVTSNRRIVCVEATLGLGGALVSGRVNAYVYRVRDGAVVSRATEPERGDRPALTEAQVVRLAQLGRRVEAHLGRPQDIEWCLADDGFAVVQCRPITTLFPVPDPGDDSGDGENHVYVSVGHQQMMTDPMKPLGLSFWQMTTPAPMAEAGGRLFVDVTRRLASPASRAGLLEALGRSDPLTGDALHTVLERDGFIRPRPDEAAPGPLVRGAPAAMEPDPALVTELIARTQASIAAAERDIGARSGEALLDAIRDDIPEMRRILFDPQSHDVFMSAMEAAWWLNDELERWLGEKNAADVLTQSVPHNITSEMGLALLDVADAIRPHPDVVAFLRHVEDSASPGSAFLDELQGLDGGQEARDAIEGWLRAYGMRCVGEIDITRPRWSERPATLLPVILGNIAHFEPGARARRFEQGRQQAWAKEQDVLARLRALPDGDRKADEAKRMIDRLRTFIGYREYPKYGMVSRYFVYKRALLAEAERLVRADVLREKEDIFYLSFQELYEVVRTRRVDEVLIGRRKEAYRSYQALTPPRVLTSEGEVVTGTYRRGNVPTGALPGLPVSAGTAEGRARVITDMAQADVEPGDILVTAYTDPSWTPLFLTVSGLVTEVGGLMTHGAVIARELGLPAVVGVVDATQLIPDGARIRVHGAEGYVEILS